ncbi:hypothetical protein AB0900_22970 [Streptomyces cellulosae]|uniref:Lipoprotein n=1 Tax=Streptomyces thermocarboxydus TaxID=59299 RepID=A0ABU3J4J9_9ACTN|nr:hypothetical protein [Streptomyces thermocarboxydus]THC54628.1 hypothetical protein E7X38_18200 [Streptomyces sp. Akac8]
MGIARLGRVLGASLAGGLLSALLSGCYSLAAAIQDPPQPPGTPQVVTDGHLVGTWRDEAGGSITFAADGAFTATKICGEFLDWTGNGPGREDSRRKSGDGSWETMVWTPSGESTPRTEMTIQFSNSDMSGEYETGGTSRSPKLWTYIGELDDYNLCTLSR